ncbi:hypothetical protein STCU_01895 [Strigomonas culicis]|uniref:SET domain-containing protein n=1 Tax=Strigomonas culicis TaxID=28005 RepID=S9V7W0_9TRYP|nr:hypothetical protein STCU_07912 [Strigomonas culicis]EPY33871.1 hypothetical protein STCU_01895 [Strigomonas culicis]|eukprot:EPY23046.1 hypothetical protein STCU_07912 [Strigomonas culicis]
MELDPDIQAAEELNTFLSRMQVPCTVAVAPDKGKHVCATADVEAEAELLEEVPLVSWPTADLTEAAAATAATAATAPSLYFCFHCLVCEWMTPPGGCAALKVAPPLPWVYCPDCLSRFCCATCVHAAHTCHALLCPYLAALRAGEAAPEAPGPRVKGCEVGARFITREALARCVGVVLRKIVTILTSQGLTAAMLAEDYQLNHSGAAARSDMLISQLFGHATAPFNRLLSTADSMAFQGIDFDGQWAPQLQCYLFQRGKQVLAAALAGDAPLTAELRPCHQGTDAVAAPPPPPPPAAAAEAEAAALAAFVLPAASTCWEEEVLLGLLRHRTLHTLLGQLALNAHAVNDFALFLARPPQRPPVDDAAAAAAALTPFFVKGAGVYSILSAFNHSCEPNLAVRNCKVTPASADGNANVYSSDDSSSSADNDSCCSTNHEITLVTTRTIMEGEEVCISYIPLKSDDTVVQRRAQLKGYFFNCACPRCTREEASAAAEATQATE